MKNPLVSIIIPTYKRINSLKAAIESVIHQSYTNIEVIVVDDNADADKNKLIQDIVSCMITDRSIKYIINEVNKGSAETRNIGIRNSEGEYITFLDDDDIYFPNKVENQLRHMLKLNSDYCITDLKLYSEHNTLVEYRRRDYIKSYDPKDLFNYHLMYHMTGTDTMMFKKEYLLKIGCFPPIDFGDEFYLMLKAITGGGIFSYLPTCDLKAYVHFETEGLSSGDSKINGENEIYHFKETFFDSLTLSKIKYIKMRHYAVLSFAEFRRKKIFRFIKYSFFSFSTSPLACLNEFIKIVMNR
jgi:glycosyltransferase involved in cell wall biosynthesis